MDSASALRALLIEIGSICFLAVVLGIIAFSLRKAAIGSAPAWTRPFPRQRQRAVPWDLRHVALVILVCLSIELAAGLLVPQPLGQHVFIAQMVIHCGAVVSDGLAALPAALAPSWMAYQQQLADAVWIRLWLIVPTRLLEITVITATLLRLAGAQLYQLGLTTHRWVADLWIAYLGWLVLTPTVLIIFALSLQIWPAKEYQEVELLLRFRPGFASWLLSVASTMILAPVFEELFVRGVLQRWMTANPRVADIVLLSVLFTAIFTGVSTQSEKGMSPAVGAVVLRVTVGSGYILFERMTRRWLPRPGAARSIYSASLIFAGMHPVWPTPIPLFFLSLGLGYLAYRTQSLIVPIVVHSLFNATSLLALIVMRLVPSWAT